MLQPSQEWDGSGPPAWHWGSTQDKKDYWLFLTQQKYALDLLNCKPYSSPINYTRSPLPESLLFKCFEKVGSEKKKEKKKELFS